MPNERGCRGPPRPSPRRRSSTCPRAAACRARGGRSSPSARVDTRSAARTSEPVEEPRGVAALQFHVEFEHAARQETRSIGPSPTIWYAIADVPAPRVGDLGRFIRPPPGRGASGRERPSARARRRPRTSRPEPATRSFTVWETSTSEGPASAATRAPMCTAMPRTSSPSISRPRRCARPRGSRGRGADRLADRRARTARPRRTRRTSRGSRRRPCRSRRPPVAERSSRTTVVVPRKQLAPRAVPQLGRALGRADDVGEQHRREPRSVGDDRLRLTRGTPGSRGPPRRRRRSRGSRRRPRARPGARWASSRPRTAPLRSARSDRPRGAGPASASWTTGRIARMSVSLEFRMHRLGGRRARASRV